MGWFTAAEFDNYDQLEALTLAHAEHHQKLHSIFSRVQLDAFSKNVLYVQQSTGGDPTDIYRQRLYVLHPGSSDDDAIRMDIWKFQAPSKYIDANKHPYKLAGLSPQSSEVAMLSGCSVYWTWDAAHQVFNGTTTDQCTVQGQDFPLPGNHTYLITDTNVLTASQVWIHEEWYLFDNHTHGPKVLGKKIPDQLTQSAPIRKFNGWIAVQNPNEVSGYSVMRNITLYNSGQTVRLVDSKNHSLPWTIELAECSYSDQPPPILKIAIYKDGESTLPGNASEYAWASPGATEVGINLRYIQGAFKDVSTL